MNESYQTWVERVIGGRDNKPLSEGEIVKSSSGQPYGPIQFVTLQKKGFKVEVGKRGNDFLYHFYPEEKHFGSMIYTFFEPLTDSLVQAFQDSDRLSAVWDEDMKSWTVLAKGFVNHVWGDELAVRAIDIFEQKLAERERES